ncbi:MAG: type II secretion system protein N [Candidatus Sericytochromatia bacterium]|nr:type II secretion system protein N [Candidatus Sericytochromatia bacterium]
MRQSVIAGVAVAALLLGSGGSGWFMLKPELERKERLTAERNGKLGQKVTLQAEVVALEAQLKQQAIGALAYFDLRTAADRRRAVEAKTVETLGSLNEIFADRHIVVQALTPLGESEAFQKPIPTPAPSSGPGASPTPSPGAPVAAEVSPAPTPTPPVSLVHKSFKLVVRGEYEDLTAALLEMQALPRAISVNQYDVRLVTKPGEAPAELEAGLSPSLLELDFQLSITFLLQGPSLPAISSRPAGGAAWLAALDAWLMPAAAAAEASDPPPLIPDPASLPPLRPPMGRDASPAPQVSTAPAATSALPVSSGAPGPRSAASPGAPAHPTLSSAPVTPVASAFGAGLPSPAATAPLLARPRAARSAPPRLTQEVRPRPVRLPPRLAEARPRPRRSVPPVPAVEARQASPLAAASPTPASPHPASAGAHAPAAARPVASPVPAGAPSPRSPLTGVVAQPAASATAPLAQPVEPTLQRALSSSYAFPIERLHVTGRRNPFLPLRAFPTAAKPAGPPGLPTVPPPPLPPGAPGVPKAPEGYLLSGVMLAESRALAVIQVGGESHTVGINGVLPGGARVVAIGADHAVILEDGRRTTLKLPR